MLVIINEVMVISVCKIKYSLDYFNFGNVQYDKDMVKDFGFVGFKVLYLINSKDKNDEIVSMFGVSYFCVLGQGQVYGLFVCGLVIDIVLLFGEEFLCFCEFWIECFKVIDKCLIIYVLLDFLWVIGVYCFVIMLGCDIVVDVQFKVYLCDKVGKLGVVLLISMFLFGFNQFFLVFNYCLVLYDFNGLLILVGNGEWIWCLLNNLKYFVVSSYVMENL